MWQGGGRGVRWIVTPPPRGEKARLHKVLRAFSASPTRLPPAVLRGSGIISHSIRLPMTPQQPASAPVLSVSELNRRVRALLENQFEMLWVAGELSNVKRAPSGHWYFCLKDPTAQVECAMFRGRAQFLDFRP